MDDLFRIWQEVWADQNIMIENSDRPQFEQALAEFAKRVQYGFSYEKFQEACHKDLESDSQVMTPNSDEYAPQLFVDEEHELGNSAILNELLSTGSVTVLVDSKRWVVSLHAVEEKV